jgi:valyl-tRNA synthetase
MKKLGHASFVERAPADVVARDRERQVELTAKIEHLKDGLARLASLRH